jgi:RNA polymerase sigma-70 factor (ECF subfamily)
VSEKWELYEDFGVFEGTGPRRRRFLARQLRYGLAGGNKMTTNTLQFPVFHSPSGVESDTVTFAPAVPSESLKMNDDLTLARLAAEGDMAAFEEIYLRHHRRVYAICLRMLQNASEAEDLTQDVFIQLYRKISSFRGDSAFTTWLHRMTVNQVLMHFRKRNVKFEKTTEEGETPDQIVAGTANPDRMRIVDKIALENAIAQLPEGYKNVFLLHDVQGFEHEEVAKILGCSVGTSKSQLHKARLKLQKLLGKKANPRLTRAAA